jgi:hypothetical protein
MQLWFVPYNGPSGVTTASGTVTGQGISQSINYTITINAPPPPPPSTTDLHSTQLNGDQISVTGDVGVCMSIKVTGTGLTRVLTCVH